MSVRLMSNPNVSKMVLVAFESTYENFNIVTHYI